MTRILVIHGHPSEEGFTARLAQTYIDGAMDGGHEVEALWLGRLSFDPILRQGYRSAQTLEPDLQKAQERLLWAEHLVFVFPVWWGGWPALLKGFVDRVFLPGFAFRYREGGTLWDRLLKGRSARLIVTSDAPVLWDRLVNRHAAVHQMRQSTLRFCGVRPVSVTRFGSLRKADHHRLAGMESTVRTLAAKAR
jgi:putative NADPH-quinone reductase